ncbi:MAG: hypothetical protein CL442_07650 [Acidimicrobiaceae bacterium]|nr:hypothetical protein [Acidimicrobiaceae bacterium]
MTAPARGRSGRPQAATGATQGVLDMERLFDEHGFGVQAFDHELQCIEHLFAVKGRAKDAIT